METTVSFETNDPTPAWGDDPAPATPEGDGRRLRRERNRGAVVEALLDLYQAGNLRPSTAEVAERAGLSPRSLFRYFDDVDDLTRAAVEGQLTRAAPLVPVTVAPDAPLEVRVAALVEQRFRLFDAVAPAATVSRLRSPFQPVLAAELRRNRAYLRDQVRVLFEPELTVLDPERAAEALAACDVAASFEAHQLLLHDQGLAPERARRAMARSLYALLATTPAGSGNGGRRAGSGS
jgi:TetR/AcrR family transcriptional regulator of autoinduction and epiphytic fitness